MIQLEYDGTISEKDCNCKQERNRESKFKNCENSIKYMNNYFLFNKSRF